MADSMEQTARSFVEACDSGKGWQVCSAYCAPNATFSAQAEALDGITTLEAYTEWAKALPGFMPDASFEIKSFGVDNEHNNVTVSAVFSATHTGEGGPCPPTGKHTDTDYVYVMDFDGGKIRHMTKIWNSGYALKELGWA